MSKKRNDYSEIVQAIKQHDGARANELLEDVSERLKDYLQVVMNASKHDAEECAQQSFIKVLERIEDDGINNSKLIFSYFLQTAKNEYLQLLRKRERDHKLGEDPDDHITRPANQIENLLDEERQRILRLCMDQLKEKQKQIMDYFFENPELSTKKASEDLNLTHGALRTRKWRIMKRLNKCYERKSSQ